MTRIEEVVTKWNLEAHEREEKIKVLEGWEKILRKEVFKNILKICDNLFYYSSKEVGENFVESYNFLLGFKEIESELNYLTFGDRNVTTLKEYNVDETMFVPMRTAERMESSSPIFINFQKENRIPIGYTFLDRIEFLLNKIKVFQIFYEKMEVEFEKAKGTDEEEQKFNDLSEFCSKNQNIFNLNNIFVIDDFIGSGSSIISFLDEIEEYFPLLTVVNMYFYVLEVSPLAISELEAYADEKNINFIVIYNKISQDIIKEIFKEPLNLAIEKQLEELNNSFRIEKSKYCINNAIASYVSTPNNNIPFIYYENGMWNPLFKRENKFGPPGMKKKAIKEKILNKRRKKMGG